MTQSYAMAVPFKYRNDAVNDAASEFNIKFFKSKNKLEDLIAFIKEYEDKTINISFPEGIHMPTLVSVNTISDNIKVRIDAADILSTKELADEGVKFFFDKDIPATNFCELASFIDLGVSDVYVNNDLVYHMTDVHEICESKGVKIRCILNRIPITAPNKNLNPKSMVFRPQDIDVLAQYFDVFEFDCGDPYQWNKHDVYARTFFEKKKWNGDLSEINPDINFDFNDKRVIPAFTEFKLDCGRRCDSRPNAKCDRCGNQQKLQKKLEEIGAKYAG